ncbi:MAG: peptidoglycan-binding protein, partial [Thiohalocapsa sp.]
YPRAQWAAWGVQRPGGPLPSDALNAALLLPMGRNGPAFLAYPNFDVYLQWNQSLVYSTTAAYFATRLAGAPRANPGNPEPGLDEEEMKLLQQRLSERGHDVGKIDGILGAKTRNAVRREQQRLALPADAWPTPELLSRLY